MVFFGALMIFSASSVTASFKMGSSYYFVIRQIFWIVVAMVGALEAAVTVSVAALVVAELTELVKTASYS